RVCHTLLEYYNKSYLCSNNINVILGGYTKGQQYIKIQNYFGFMKSLIIILLNCLKMIKI
ncbi:hypothetical protein JQ035_19955, partial [Clostridium botulinum]|nr:hypothetical protein [Clostridium botulinum]